MKKLLCVLTAIIVALPVFAQSATGTKASSDQKTTESVKKRSQAPSTEGGMKMKQEEQERKKVEGKKMMESEAPSSSKVMDEEEGEGESEE